jgi:hypothetical protein
MVVKAFGYALAFSLGVSAALVAVATQLPAPGVAQGGGLCPASLTMPAADSGGCPYLAERRAAGSCPYLAGRSGSRCPAMGGGAAPSCPHAGRPGVAPPTPARDGAVRASLPARGGGAPTPNRV